MVFLVILLFAFLIAAFICALKESAVTSVYKENGVYGRFSAYMALDLFLVGLFAIIGSIILILAKALSDDSTVSFSQTAGVLATTIIIGVVCLAIGILIYHNARRKCPDDLKSKCIKSMIITGLGVSVKLAVFFIPAVWSLSGSQTGYSGGFSSEYIRSSDRERFFLHSSSNHTALLRDFNGNLTEVFYNGSSEGIVTDKSGNIYRPAE